MGSGAGAGAGGEEQTAEEHRSMHPSVKVCRGHGRSGECDQGDLVTWLTAGPCAQLDTPAGCVYSGGTLGSLGQEAERVNKGPPSWEFAGSRYHLLPHPGDSVTSDTEPQSISVRLQTGGGGTASEEFQDLRLGSGRLTSPSRCKHSGIHASRFSQGPVLHSAS